MMASAGKERSTLWRGGWQSIAGLVMILALLPCLSGCGDNIRPPTPEQIAAFEAAEPIVPPVDMERIKKARLHTGPYRVVPGDVLEFAMPALLRAVTEAEARAAQSQDGRDYPFICRVSNEGTITLPAVGRLDVTGKSLAEIEARLIEAYEAYAVRRPSIYARVLEYSTAKVYIAGAVQNPGVYTLQTDQMTLVSLLTEAGGISEAGAALVRIISSESREELTERGTLPGQDDSTSETARGPRTQDQEQGAEHPTIILPVVGMNIPFEDVALSEGDTVVVEPVQMPMMSVLGLVRNPGNFDYPPHARYNLAQAIALAGGLQMDVDPRYATVYRMTGNGTILRLPFRLVEDDRYTENLEVAIRPGDLVVVENTPRTRTNAFVNRTVRFSIGTWINVRDLFDDN